FAGGAHPGTGAAIGRPSPRDGYDQAHYRPVKGDPTTPFALSRRPLSHRNDQGQRPRRATKESTRHDGNDIFSCPENGRTWPVSPWRREHLGYWLIEPVFRDACGHQALSREIRTVV